VAFLYFLSNLQTMNLTDVIRKLFDIKVFIQETAYLNYSCTVSIFSKVSGEWLYTKKPNQTYSLHRVHIPLLNLCHSLGIPFSTLDIKLSRCSPIRLKRKRNRSIDDDNFNMEYIAKKYDELKQQVEINQYEPDTLLPSKAFLIALKKELDIIYPVILNSCIIVENLLNGFDEEE